MKAWEIRLDKLMTISNQQFIAPIFQRKYSWKDEQCTRLWEDIINISEVNNPEAWHYIWSLVCHQPSIALPWKVNEQMIIDWQQRLTTMSLIVLAIARWYKQLWDENTHKVLMENYIINQNQSDNWAYKYKLIPTYEDRETYFAIVDWTEDKLQNPSKQLLNNFRLFCDYLNWDKELLEKAYLWINRLDLVYVVLSQWDNPQMIFESMNSTGLNLSQWDLLRNYLLLWMSQSEQERLYKTYWKPMEQSFGQEWYANNFDEYLRDYITIYEKNWPRIWEEYEEYKEFFWEWEKTKEDLLKDLEKYSKYYVRIALWKDPDKELNKLWNELKIQRIWVSLPFLMRVYCDYEGVNGIWKLSKEDFIEIINTVLSYVYRRYIVWIPTNSLNKTFAILYNSVKESDYKNSVLATLILLDSYKEFPNDEEFKKSFSKKDMYNTRLKNYTLEKLENDNHLNNIIIDWSDISIEHILPETDVLKPHWQAVLWENWKELQKDNVHRIWNLTITKWVYNSKMSDLPFLEKLAVEWGIRDSHYRLSNDIVNRQKWDVEDINERSLILAEQACKIWKYPNLTEQEIEPYKNLTISKKETIIYENMDHLPKMDNKIQTIFNEYQNFILSLDWVVEDIKKQYVSYKIDWENFVEIVPHKSLFKVMIDIPYKEIQNPADFIEDVEWKWFRWTWTTRILVRNIENFEYIKWLIKKSLIYNKEWDLD